MNVVCTDTQLSKILLDIVKLQSEEVREDKLKFSVWFFIPFSVGSMSESDLLRQLYTPKSMLF